MGAKNAPLLPNELVEAVDSAHGAVDSEVGDHAPNTKRLKGGHDSMLEIKKLVYFEQIVKYIEVAKKKGCVAFVA